MMTDFGFRPDLAAFRENPYPVYAELQRRSPVLYRPLYDDWLITGYREVKQVLSERVSGNADMAACPVSTAEGVQTWLRQGGDWPLLYRWLDQHNLLNLPAEPHRRLRPLVKKSLETACGASLQADIASICEQLLDGAASEQAELISDYAAPLVAGVFTKIMGLPVDSAETIVPLARDYLAGKDLTSSRKAQFQSRLAFIKLAAYLDDCVRGESFAESGLVAALLGYCRDGQLSYYEFLAQVLSLALGGFENTQSAIGLAVYHLLSCAETAQPDQLSDAALNLALEECVRYDSPIQCLYSKAGQDRMLGEHRIKRGQRVYLIIGAANRDPGHFGDAASFIPDRTGPTHLTFGHGRHVCLGAGLSRMEIFIAIRHLFARFPGATLAAEPTWGTGYVYRGLERLELRLR